MEQTEVRAVVRCVAQALMPGKEKGYGRLGVKRIQGAVERYDRSDSLWVKPTT